jgi:hypothetical protein
MAQRVEVAACDRGRCLDLDGDNRSVPSFEERVDLALVLLDGLKRPEKAHGAASDRQDARRARRPESRFAGISQRNATSNSMRGHHDGFVYSRYEAAHHCPDN